MGANQNRFGNEQDRGGSWDGKTFAKAARKAGRHGAQDEAIDDSVISNKEDWAKEHQMNDGEYAQDLLESGVDPGPIIRSANKPAKKRKKDTKNWCKGKVGVPHDYVEREHTGWLGRKYIEYVCSGCGKKDWQRRP